MCGRGLWAAGLAAACGLAVSQNQRGARSGRAACQKPFTRGSKVKNTRGMLSFPGALQTVASLH